MLSCTGKRSHRHTILHVSFSNSFGLASAQHSTGFVGCAVFSLIFHKPFIALVPPNCKDKGGNMRINTLLKNMGLFNRIVEYFDQKRTQEILKESINWDDVDMKIHQLRNLSIEFLNDNLK